LKLTYAVLDRVYALQRTVSQNFLAACSIQFADLLPDWNYTVVPG
jgi:hypothetical protein